MTSEPLKPQKVLDGIFTGYKKMIKVNVPKVEPIPNEAYEDLQETMRAEVLFKINEILDNYNIEPRRTK